MSILRHYEGNTSIQEELLLSFGNCKELTLTVTYRPESKAKANLLDFFRKMEQGIVNTLLAKLRLFKFQFPFYFITILSIIIVGVGDL